MWKDSSKGDGGTDERIEFFVSADCELQVTWGNTLDFKVLGCVLYE